MGLCGAVSGKGDHAIPVSREARPRDGRGCDPAKAMIVAGTCTTSLQIAPEFSSRLLRFVRVILREKMLKHRIGVYRLLERLRRELASLLRIRGIPRL